MFRRQFCTSLAAAAVILFATPVEAITNSELARQSMLKISNAVAGEEVILSMDDLRGLPTHTLTTSTPWTDGAIEFEGVYFKDIVEKFGREALNGRATAFNDYQIEFELHDIVEKQGFIAFKRDGMPMSRRDKGPFWMIFPWTERPELDSRAVHGLSIWQLVDLSFN